MLGGQGPRRLRKRLEFDRIILRAQRPRPGFHVLEPQRFASPRFGKLARAPLSHSSRPVFATFGLARRPFFPLRGLPCPGSGPSAGQEKAPTGPFSISWNTDASGLATVQREAFRWPAGAGRWIGDFFARLDLFLFHAARAACCGPTRPPAKATDRPSRQRLWPAALGICRWRAQAGCEGPAMVARSMFT